MKITQPEAGTAIVPPTDGLTLAQAEIAWLSAQSPGSDFHFAFERAGKDKWPKEAVQNLDPRQ